MALIYCVFSLEEDTKIKYNSNTDLGWESKWFWLVIVTVFQILEKVGCVLKF